MFRADSSSRHLRPKSWGGDFLLEVETGGFFHFLFNAVFGHIYIGDYLCGSTRTKFTKQQYKKKKLTFFDEKVKNRFGF